MRRQVASNRHAILKELTFQISSENRSSEQDVRRRKASAPNMDFSKYTSTVTVPLCAVKQFLQKLITFLL